MLDGKEMILTNMTSNEDNLEVPTSISPIPDPSLNCVVRNKLKRLIMFNSIILFVCLITLFTRIYTNIVSTKKKRQHDKLSYFVFEIVLMVMSIMNAVYGLGLAIYEERKHRNDQILNCKLVNFIHLILNLICVMIFSFFVFIEFLHWCRDLLNDNEVYNSVRLLIIVLSLLIVLCQTACIIENRLLGWSPKYRYSRFILCFSSTILIAISIISIIFDGRISHLQLDIEPGGSVPLWSCTILQASSSYTIICGLIGIVLTFVYGRKNSELNQFRKCFSHFFHIFCTFGLILIVIFTIILLSYHIKLDDRTKSVIIHSNLFVSIVQCILLVIGMTSLHSLVRVTRSNRNGLTIERIRLSETLPSYMTYWTTAIDEFNCIPEGMTGDAAIQLMKAYENGELENIECVVLRIGRIGRRITISNNQDDDTEAIVLLTIVHRYDATVTSHLNSFWSTVLKRTLGSKNCTKYFRPLVLRLGLIGYQWPFRTSIFFITPHQDPLTRAAHVLETIIDWNEMQNSHIRCDLLLLPTLSIESIAKAIPIAGFFSLMLPPTHLLDLRPHHGKTWKEYMKTLKKGNRRPYIQQFLMKGGTIEEIHDLTSREVGESVCQQWENIARMRRKNREPPTLAKPSVEFIRSMGNAMSEAYRSVVFLRVNNEVIASSVIYKFPHKMITTDIQGLTHEKARPLKAYFVMLQWVIKEALDQKYHFVDFGATTPGPKIDLGCKSVPFEVGGYARNPILAFGIQQSCLTLNTIHKKRDNQQQDTFDQDQKKHDESQLDKQRLTDNNTLPSQTSSDDVTLQNSPEASSMNRNYKIRPTALSVHKINSTTNQEPTTSNGEHHPYLNTLKNKQSVEETK